MGQDVYHNSVSGMILKFVRVGKILSLTMPSEWSMTFIVHLLEHPGRPMLPHFHDTSGLEFRSNLWNTRQWIAMAAFSKDETLQSISENDPIL